MQVRGFCKDKSNPDVFDDVNVYGNIYDSEMHHLNFAVYTYGHQQGDWRRNVVHSNSGYGKQRRIFRLYLLAGEMGDRKQPSLERQRLFERCIGIFTRIVRQALASG